MLVNYKQTLETAKKYGIDPISLQVANEVECTIVEFEMSNEEFEMICGFVEQCYLESEYSSIWSITRALRDLILKDVFSEEEEDKVFDSIENLIQNLDVYDLLEVASYYD